MGHGRSPSSWTSSSIFSRSSSSIVSWEGWSSRWGALVLSLSSHRPSLLWLKRDKRRDCFFLVHCLVSVHYYDVYVCTLPIDELFASRGWCGSILRSSLPVFRFIPVLVPCLYRVCRRKTTTNPRPKKCPWGIEVVLAFFGSILFSNIIAGLRNTGIKN